jgi:hypothetical protein
MSITDFITDWRFAILAYCLIGIALVTLHPGIRRTAKGNYKSLRAFVASQKRAVASQRDDDDYVAVADMAWYLHLKAYARVAADVVRTIVTWPAVVRLEWQWQRDSRQRQHEWGAQSRQDDFTAYASELSPQDSRESFDALWRAKIPEGCQSDLPRFIHFRHTVDAFDEVIGKRSMLGTLTYDGNEYGGDFTIYSWSETATSPETIIPVRLAGSDVRRLMDALRAVRLRREIPPSHTRKYSYWKRFHLIRRLAVSAPTGCVPCLFEMESDEVSLADARWDCVSYGGWAIDSVHARRSNHAWLAEGGIEHAYEALIDAMEIRKHLTRLPVGLKAMLAKSLR